VPDTPATPSSTTDPTSAGPSRTGPLTAIVGPTLLPGPAGRRIDDAMIIVDGSRFVWVGRRSERSLPPDARVIDASGQWMIPGLVEGHCHVSGFASAAYHPGLGPYAAAPGVMAELARHGITTVRDTGGPDLESMQSLQSHDQAWPRFFGSGPNLDGHPGGPWKGMWKSDDPAEARRYVALEDEGGADFIKIYAWMKAPVMQVVVDEAHRRGLTVAGHVGWEVTVEDAVRMGVDALEHVRVGRELVDESILRTIAALPYRHHDELASGAPWRWADPDGPAATRVLDLLVDHGVYLTPTLVVHERVLHASETVQPEGGDPELGAAFDAHEDGAGLARDYSAEDLEHGRIEFERICRFVARAAEAGVPIVAGSDAPSASIRPGLSLHEELSLLVAAGLSSAQAVEAATATPAALLGRARIQGRIANGYLADFVLLDADPIADIANTTKIAATWRDGAPLVPE
jgi:imidazolonepropionase-like amidohydrolase